jgi:hypothetical protein
MARFIRPRPVRKRPNYSRQGMRQWLESLPPDEPFCRNMNCPIRQYVGETEMGVYGIDGQLVSAIDRAGVPWKELKPFQVIFHIDMLEAEGK